jgi:hypothetical protein
MKPKSKKGFDTVAFFRAVKEKIGRNTEGMTLEERRKFMQQLHEGKINLA